MPDFSSLFHQSSKSLSKGRPIIPENYSDWPDYLKTTYYKTYPRLPKIKLIQDQKPEADFFDLIENRKSKRDFLRKPISLQELSLLLRYSGGNFGPLDTADNRKRRAQPSGGLRFPIELYPIVFRSNFDNVRLASGLYHYSVKENELGILWDRGFDDNEIDSLFSYPWIKDAALVIVMTAVFPRNQDSYGERGYRYILLEAGHIAQNMYLIAEALGLKCCALGATRDEAIEKLLDIDGVTESVVYAVAIGK